jgi:hypothetical protein
LKRDFEACSVEGHPRNSLGRRSEQIRTKLSSRCHAVSIPLSTSVAAGFAGATNDVDVERPKSGSAEEGNAPDIHGFKTTAQGCFAAVRVR